jgi:hypothetical protein
MKSGFDGEIDAGEVPGEFRGHKLLEAVAVDIETAMRALAPYDRRMREQ